jgi:hypothetical protein
MEGWFPRDGGEQACLRIAEAAERHLELAGASRQRLPLDPAATLPQPDLTRRDSSARALPNIGVDAGCKIMPVVGDVSLDIPLHGSRTSCVLGDPPSTRGAANVR